MPIKVQCPEAGCGHVLTVRDEMAGKKGRCPRCGSVIAIPSAEEYEVVNDQEEPPPRATPVARPLEQEPRRRAEEEEQERHTQRRSRSRPREEELEEEELEEVPRPDELKRDPQTRRAWRRAHLGLTLVFWHLGMLALGMILNLLSICVVGVAVAESGGRFFLLLSMCASQGVLLLSWGLWTAEQASARSLRQSAAAVYWPLSACPWQAWERLLFLLSFVGAFLPVAELRLLAGICFLASSLLNLAAFPVFLFFLRAAALALNNAELAKAILIYIIAWSGTAFLFLAGYFGLLFIAYGVRAFGLITERSPRSFGVGGGDVVGALLVFTLLGGVVGLAEFVWYVILVARTRTLVGDVVGV